MSSVLGIDVGTSGCKITALSETGKVIGSVSREWFPCSRTDGTSEQDPNDWLDGIRLGVAELEQQGILLAAVRAIGITGQMQGATFVDNTGRPVRHSILWNDTRSSGQSRRILATLGNSIQDTIGCSFSDGLTLGKILWLRENEPANWDKVYQVLQASCFVAHVLTGRFVIDIHNLGQTGMNEVSSGGWSDRILDEFEVPADVLPEIVGATEVMGMTSDQAKLLGLPEGVPVICAGGDSGSESFSIALAGSHRMKVRLGTAADMNLVRPYESGKPGTRDVVPGYVMLGAYTKSCASSVRWIRELLYSEEPNEPKTFSVMDKEAAQVPVGSEGVIFHPYLAGEADPYFNSSMQGMLRGLRHGVKRGHIVRAVYEGVAMSIRNAIEQSTHFRDVSELVFLGGGTKSSLFLNSVADVLGRDGIVPPESGASFGAALIAGNAIELWDGFELANENLKNGKLVSFSEENHEVLLENYATFLQEAIRENDRNAQFTN